MAYFKKCNTKEELTAKLAEVTEEIKLEYNDKLNEIEVNAKPDTPPDEPPEDPPVEPPENPVGDEPPETPKPKKMTRAEKKQWRRDNRNKKDEGEDEEDE